MGYSVVNQDLYRKIHDGTVGSSTYGTNLGYNLIRITPNLEKWAWRNELTNQDRQDAMFRAMNKAMVGLMTNELQYNLISNWETMEYPAILNMGLVSDLAAFRGGGEFGAVFKSKKVWKKSGDLTVTPEIRIIDVNGDGLPLRTARQMIMWSTSLGERSLFGDDGAEDVENLEASARGALTSLAGTIQSGTQSLVEGLNPREGAEDNAGKISFDASSLVNLGGEILTVASQGASNLLEDIDDYAKLKFSPPPLRVQIGRIFDHDDMVLTNVDFTFSRECTVSGPIYVDMKLTLVTRTIVSDVNDTGLYRAVDTPGRGNIVLTGGAQTEVPQAETPANNFRDAEEVTWRNGIDPFAPGSVNNIDGRTGQAYFDPNVAVDRGEMSERQAAAHAAGLAGAGSNIPASYFRR